MSVRSQPDPTTAALAVLATFDPRKVPAAFAAEGRLESSCIEVEPEHGDPALMLSESTRIETLASLLRNGGRKGLAAVRSTIQPHYPSPLQRMLDAFVRQDDIPLAERSEDELAASLHVERWSTAALARAELSGERVRPGREEIEGRLRILDVERPIRALLQRGFIGRDEELAQLEAYRLRTRSSGTGGLGEPGGLHGNPAFLVYGVGGMGKSTLVARFVRSLIDTTESAPPVWAYLDFDRATLQPQAGNARPGSLPPTWAQLVLDDLVRQIGAQRPEARSVLESELHSAKQLAFSAGLEAPDEGYRGAAYKMAENLRRVLGGTALVVVLDTFEEVERRGLQEAQQIFELFQTIASAFPGLSLVVSGRTPAVAFRTGSENELQVGELTESDALELLRHFLGTKPSDPSIDADAARDVWEIVGRSPLSLQLAARAIADEGVDAFTDAARRAQTLGRVRSEFVRGFLYHRIIDHLKPSDTDLREPLKVVARAALVLRTITRPTIEHVLLPALDRPASSDLSEQLFEALQRESALVRLVDANTLGVREELRGPALSALKLDDGDLVRRVHEQAVVFHGGGWLGSDLVEAAFHRLAEGNLDVALTTDALYSLERSSAELPRQAADYLKTLREGGAATDADRKQIEWERQVASTVDTALRSGNPAAARQALKEREERRPTTELYRMDARTCEAEGDLDAAIAAAHRDLAASRQADHATRVAGAFAYLAKLLEWRGRGSEALTALAEADADPLLAGEWSLRLELLLVRLATAERTSLEHDDTRWDLGLRARQYLGRLDAHARVTPALTRLLAAVLGREEPIYIRDAVKRVGLDPEAEAELGARLGDALADWDRLSAGRDGAEGEADGPVARSLKLPGPSASPDVWISWVSGLGASAGDVFGDAFWALSPPLPVLAALRTYYVWWGYQLPPSLRLKATIWNSSTHFLDHTHLDHSRPELRELESQLMSSYPRTEELERLASVAGLDRSAIDWHQPLTILVRTLLNAARAADRMEELVRAILRDAPPERARAFRAIIGADWLASRGAGGGIMTGLEVPLAAGLQPQSVEAFVGAAPPLSDADKRATIDQALILMEELYVHLPLKRAMYATDPVQRLKLLRHRLPADRGFQEEMISIFTGCRDLHTNYLLPAPYRSATAVLPFQIGEYFDGDSRRYIVATTAGDDASFRPGFPVTHWNGIPIARAVELNARLHAGGNDAAKQARGLQRMSVRPLMMSLPPDEAWVDVRYLDAAGQAHERRFEWKVVVPQPTGAVPEAVAGAVDEARMEYLLALGIDAENEAANQVIEAVFNERQVRIDADILKFLEGGGGGLESTGGPDFTKVSTMPQVFRFGTVQTPDGALGRIEIRTFNVPNPDAFVGEFVRILALLPQDRLIVDVRGNGGGNILAGEKLLQTLTDAEIEPERFHFINTPLVLALAEATPSWFERWLPSLRRAVTTGAVFSQGLPFLDRSQYNAVGRKYPGKVVLLTDAFCYSTTDIFTAGFRDHRIGPILGTMENTGAGGANVFEWTLVTQLAATLPGQRIQPPPHGATFRVAIRASTRVGDSSGVLLEDLGVEPDEVHRTTLRDLTEDEVDLFAHAARILGQV